MGFMKSIVENPFLVILLLQETENGPKHKLPNEDLRKSRSGIRKHKFFPHPFNIGSKTLKYKKLKLFHDDNLRQILT